MISVDGNTSNCLFFNVICFRAYTLKKIGVRFSFNLRGLFERTPYLILKDVIVLINYSRYNKADIKQILCIHGTILSLAITYLIAFFYLSVVSFFMKDILYTSNHVSYLRGDSSFYEGRIIYCANINFHCFNYVKKGLGKTNLYQVSKKIILSGLVSSRLLYLQNALVVRSKKLSTSGVLTEIHFSSVSVKIKRMCSSQK